MAFVQILKPGLLTTVQDLGRTDYKIFGVSESGAMDPLSLRLANLLVGNDEGTAGLEATLIGPKLRFEASALIAVTGGDLSPTLNNQPVSMWKALKVDEGDELSFGQCIDGCRSYIAFAGGVQVPQVMGSRSTYIRGHYGGFEGRALKTGDRIPIGIPQLPSDQLYGRKLRFDHIPDYREEKPIRFILGPHEDAFTPESIHRFVTTSYTVLNESDRMGYRMTGEALEHIQGADIISDFVTVGTIQVPGSGQPIVHMADCGTSGGYTKLGVIIGVDRPYIAQKKPGDTLYFEQTDVPSAQTLWREQEQRLSSVRLSNALIARKSS